MHDVGLAEIHAARPDTARDPVGFRLAAKPFRLLVRQKLHLIRPDALFDQRPRLSQRHLPSDHALAEQQAARLLGCVTDVGTQQKDEERCGPRQRRGQGLADCLHGCPLLFGGRLDVQRHAARHEWRCRGRRLVLRVRRIGLDCLRQGDDSGGRQRLLSQCHSGRCAQRCAKAAIEDHDARPRPRHTHIFAAAPSKPSSCRLRIIARAMASSRLSSSYRRSHIRARHRFLLVSGCRIRPAAVTMATDIEQSA